MRDDSQVLGLDLLSQSVFFQKWNNSISEIGAQDNWRLKALCKQKPANLFQCKLWFCYSKQLSLNLTCLLCFAVKIFYETVYGCPQIKTEWFQYLSGASRLLGTFSKIASISNPNGTICKLARPPSLTPKQSACLMQAKTAWPPLKFSRFLSRVKTSHTITGLINEWCRLCCDLASGAGLTSHLVTWLAPSHERTQITRVCRISCTASTQFVSARFLNESIYDILARLFVQGECVCMSVVFADRTISHAPYIALSLETSLASQPRCNFFGDTGSDVYLFRLDRSCSLLPGSFTLPTQTRAHSSPGSLRPAIHGWTITWPSLTRQRPSPPWTHRSESLATMSKWICGSVCLGCNVLLSAEGGQSSVCCCWACSVQVSATFSPFR